MWTPQQRLELANMLQKMEMPAHFDSCLESICVWQSDLLLSFKKVYNEEKQKGADLSEGIVMKSRGRPTLLPETLMKKNRHHQYS